jgi:ABC-2 type transport system ATP-binding protein
MRALIQRLNRERGITVLFCSHLLAEVEQLCDHVVILNQGRKVFDGRWAELAGDRRSVRFEVDDWPRAAALLQTIPEVTVSAPGLVVLGGKVAVPDLVSRLVEGGLRVSAVEPQRRNLEELYLSITHSGAPASLP